MTEDELIAHAKFCVSCGAQLTLVEDTQRRSSSGALLYRWREKACPAKCGEVVADEHTLIWFPRVDE